MQELNDRQRRFAELYVASPLAGKQCECVRAAGYNPTDGESASAMGHRLKENPRVRAYIEKLIAQNITAAAKQLLPDGVLRPPRGCRFRLQRSRAQLHCIISRRASTETA